MPYKNDASYQYHREYRARNKEIIAAKQKKFYEDNPDKREERKVYLKSYNKAHRVAAAVMWMRKNPNRYQYNQCKARAKKNEIPFDLVYEEMIWPTHCPVLGIELTRLKRDHCPSLDRVDPTKGYTKDNVRIISGRANRMKQNATLDQLKSLVRYVEDHLSSVVKTID